MERYGVYFVNWEGVWMDEVYEVFDNREDAEKFVEELEEKEDGMLACDEGYIVVEMD